MIHTILRHGRALWLNRQWRRLILGGTTAASLGLLLWGLLRGWPELARQQWQFDWRPLVLSGVLYSVPLGLAVLAWGVIMRALQAGTTWRQDTKFFLYSWIARRLPTAGPYIASRILLYEEAGVPKRVTSVGLLWENMLIIAAGALLAILMLPITPVIGDHVVLAPVLVAVVAGLVFVVRPALLTHLVNWVLRRMGKAPLTTLMRPSMAALALGIYAVTWLAGGVILFLLIRAVYPIEWSWLPLVTQGWVISGLAAYVVFFAPLGFGVRELTLVALLSLAVPLPVAVVIVLLSRLWVMGNELVWALIVYKW